MLYIGGAVNSGWKNNYKIADEKPYGGLSYYRLATSDISMQIKYSDLVSVNFNSSEEAGFFISPNPSEGMFSINFKGFANMATIQLTELSGKLIFVTTLYDISNNKAYALDLKNKLQQGIYLISVYSDTKTYNQKIIIK